MSEIEGAVYDKFACGKRPRGGRARVESPGSEEEGAFHVEFGTRLRPLAPWLFPALLARSRTVNERLRQLLATAFKSSGRV
jgi:hypothetical protein